MTRLLVSLVSIMPLVWGGAALADEQTVTLAVDKIVMASAVLAFAFGALPLGEHGWVWLGIATFVGNALLWWESERLLGRFLASR